MAANLAPVATSARPAAQNLSALKQVFETIDADSCPRIYNFHLHTVHSDGRLRPDEVIEQAIAIGLQGFAITDHHSTQGYQVAQAILNAHCDDSGLDSPATLPWLWTGIEINAELLGIEVHILGYGFAPDHPALQPYNQRHAATGQDYTAQQVIAALHEAGGLAVLAHPARYRRSPAELIPAAAHLGIDGIETYYAYSNPIPWQTSPEQTAIVSQLGATYGLLNTCGTDTHGYNLLQRL